MSDEFRVSVTVLCRNCGLEVGQQYFDIDSDQAVDLEASTCPDCENMAFDSGYSKGMTAGEIKGYAFGYDDGYEEGCEANIDFVNDYDDAEPPQNSK